MKLDKRTVDALAAEERERVVWDDELPGFGLRIYPSGRKVFVIQYRNSYGRSRRMKVGVYGRVTPREARSRAKVHLGRVEDGHDPCEQRQRKRGSRTVRDLAERFMAEHAPKRAASTQRSYELSWRPILDAIGAKAVREVRWDDFEALHRSLSDTPYGANRVLALGSKAWELAARWGWWPRDSANPARRHDRYAEHPRGRALNRDQLRRLGQALKALPDGSISSAALVATMLSGCRPVEMCRARWDQLEWGGRILRLKKAKTGPRAVYLGAPVVELLADLPRMSNFIFPGRDSSRPLHDMRSPWVCVRDVAELREVRLYDATRHTFISTAAQLGVPRERRKLLVGHVPGTDAHDRYIHGLEEALLSDADNVSSHLRRALFGVTTYTFTSR